MKFVICHLSGRDLGCFLVPCVGRGAREGGNACSSCKEAACCCWESCCRPACQSSCRRRGLMQKRPTSPPNPRNFSLSALLNLDFLSLYSFCLCYGFSHRWESSAQWRTTHRRNPPSHKCHRSQRTQSPLPSRTTFLLHRNKVSTLPDPDASTTPSPSLLFCLFLQNASTFVYPHACVTYK